MKINKNNLIKWGIVSGLVFGLLFILIWPFSSNVMKNAFWAISSVAWVSSLVIGILIIIDGAKDKKDLLYIISGILLILFPLIGGIILVVVFLQNNKKS
ncbi:MAG: hypothetical protein HRT99_01770 [Mycoplasmatales bacterium]|nr:hypothetical protein [Mycoplasmatales bacterium]